MRQEAPRRAGQPCRAPARLGAAQESDGAPLKVVAGLSLVCPGLDLLVAHVTSLENVLTHGNIV